MFSCFAELVCVKECNDKKITQDRPQPWGTRKPDDCYYVLTDGKANSSLRSIDLASELQKFADFSRLESCNKVAKRLELLVSPADKIDCRRHSWRIYDSQLAPFDFESVQEENNLGCGFIPKSILEKLFGKEGKYISSVQVRIIIPSMGLFKGMLTLKNGIKKIQLPPSMLKVPKSVWPDRQADVYVLMNKVFPSYKTRNVVQKLIKGDPLNDRELTMVKDVLAMKTMRSNVLQLGGVKRETIDKYLKLIEKNPQQVQHANVVGVADPTGEIEPEQVFITGEHTIKEVIVTRYPCTWGQDQIKLRVIRPDKRPVNMSEEGWECLRQREFGEIIFGPPKSGMTPIPEIIADGDLDGDLYHICWYEPFLQEIGEATVPQTPQSHETPSFLDFVDEAQELCWLQNTQQYLVDPGLGRKVISVTHSLWENATSEYLSHRGNDKLKRRVYYFGEAFKRSLEIGKHGGKIPLPSNLLKFVEDEKLHEFFCDSVSGSSVPALQNHADEGRDFGKKDKPDQGSSHVKKPFHRHPGRKWLGSMSGKKRKRKHIVH